jgi:hypothetical protein
VAVLLLLAAGWFGNLALFNWWAAGGPPTPHPEVYRFRGNAFFGFASVLFAGAVIVFIRIFRARKR